MRVEFSRISKANICPYIGREIPKWQELGLQPEKTYRLFRDPEELKSTTRTIDGQSVKCGAWSFDGKPLLIKHVPIDAELPRKELWVGSVGNCTFEAPYVISRPLMVLTKEAIDLINGDDPGREQQRELSAAYRYDARMEPGTWGGQNYDGRMVNIRGNHVAIVTEGRAGSDVHVADELPPELRMRNLVAAAVASAIKPYLGEKPNTRCIAMALDSMLGETPAETVMSLDAEECKAAEDAFRKAHDKAADAELTDEEREEAYERARDRKAKDKKARDKKAADKKAAEDKKATDSKKAQDEREAALDAREAAMDAKEEDDDKDKDDEPAKDRKRARDSRKTARDKRAHDRGGKAHDALPDPNDHRRDFRSNAEDSVSKDELPEILRAHGEGIRKQMRDAAEAREKVRPLVGQVSIAMDSAEEVYRFALKHAGVKADDVKDVAALGAMVDMAVQSKGRPSSPQPIAMDATRAGLVDVDAIFAPRAA